MIKLPIEKCKVLVTAEPEDLAVEDYFNTENAELDNQLAQKIIDDLESGNMYAWFCARVTVSYLHMSESEYLGCCSYDSEKDFIADSGYYMDMAEEARQRLELKINELYSTFKNLEKIK